MSEKERLDYLKKHIMEKIKDLNDPKDEKQKTNLLFLTQSLLAVEKQLGELVGEK